MDRCLWIRESPYYSALLKMYPLEATPKNDIIFAYPEESRSILDEIIIEDVACTSELRQLGEKGPLADFPADEVEHIRHRLQHMGKQVQFSENAGNRHRKMVHAVAEEMGLLHYSHGHGASRCVIVSRRDAGTPPQPQR